MIPRPAVATMDNLSKQQVALLGAAERALRSTASNSAEGILVGSAIRTIDGAVFAGGNMRARDAIRHVHSEEVAVMNAEGAGYFRADGAGIVAVATIASYADGDHRDPKLICDDCSRMLLKIAARSGVDTEIVVANTAKTIIVVTTITQMFRYRNIPHGEVDIADHIGDMAPVTPL